MEINIEDKKIIENVIQLTKEVKKLSLSKYKIEKELLNNNVKESSNLDETILNLETKKLIFENQIQKNNKDLEHYGKRLNNLSKDNSEYKYEKRTLQKKIADSRLEIQNILKLEVQNTENLQNALIQLNKEKSEVDSNITNKKNEIDNVEVQINNLNKNILSLKNDFSNKFKSNFENETTFNIVNFGELIKGFCSICGFMMSLKIIDQTKKMSKNDFLVCPECSAILLNRIIK